MKQFTASIASKLWWLSCKPYALLFHKACKNPAEIQKMYILNLLKKNADSEYGHKHNFSKIRDVKQYQEIVPVTGYENLQPAIERMMTGERNILTTQRILAFEKTSGSTSGSKYIPLTHDLLTEFKRGAATWLDDLFRNNSALHQGTAYWSISPSAGSKEFTSGGIKIGLDSDTEYFGRFGHAMLVRTLAVPVLLHGVDDIKAHRYLTLRFLLDDRNLRLISVWHPGFLTLLLDAISMYAEDLILDIADGTIQPPGDTPRKILKSLRRMCKPNTDRAKELEQAFNKLPLLAANIWRNLRLVSCWTSGESRKPAESLQKRLGDIQMQGKGLLATEGIVSVPLLGYGGCFPCITSHFLEFADKDNPQALPKLVHELESGKTYSVILSTGGGLYRYKLGDLVEVTGFCNKIPLLEFVGRESNICDLCGEKLNERHVADAINQAAVKSGIELKFAMLAPVRSPVPHYVLFFELCENTYHDSEATPAVLSGFIKEVENILGSNFHYAHCRRLNQLDSLKGWRIYSRGAETCLEEKTRRGSIMGDIKSTALDKGEFWHEVFDGKWVEVEN